MYIGIDCRELTGKLTGIGRILNDFFSSVSSKNTGHKFILFGNQDTYLEDEFFNKNIFQKVFIPERITLLWDQVKLKKMLDEYKIDVFFSPYYKIPFLTKTKTILSIFDVTYLLVKPYTNYFKNKFYIKNFIKLASKKTKKIITCSNYTKNDLLKTLNLPKDKLEVVYLGVSPKFKTIHEKNKIELVKKKYEINKKYILYVGNFKPHKNVKRLIEAYNLLPETIKQEYDLVLGGGEPKRSVIDDKRLGPSDLQYIIYVGHILEEDLPALYSGAELFIFPSLYEGFGLPPLEAMACGCPVASSNTSSMPEVLDDAALFFDPYDVEEMSKAFKRMLEDENLRNRFRQKGLARAKLFTSEKTTKKLISLFESVYGN
ncbi:MAG: glycosyltransferase family 4 protein [Candidatus Aminicenantia bacterium]